VVKSENSEETGSAKIKRIGCGSDQKVKKALAGHSFVVRGGEGNSGEGGLI
jgi:hypothetical protein